MADRTRRAIGYARVSTTEQAQYGLSLDAQTARLQEAAPAYGYAIERVIVDSTSGGVAPDKRAGMAEALGQLRSGMADCLVVTKLDRLSRSTLDSLNLIEVAARERWEVVSLSEQLDTATPGGRFIITILAAFAEMERSQISERTRAGMDQVRREGRARSRFIPFGYRVDGEPEKVTLAKGERRQLVCHRQEQELLRRMFILREKGRGPFAIASQLNQQGLSNPRTSRAWTPGNVASILDTESRNRR